MPAVYPLDWLPTTTRGRYPHFAKRDAPVWTRWLDAFANRYDAFAYDVALGGGALPEATGTEAERKGWQYVTALKVDAVGLTADNVWLFEVRPEATVSTLGSALAYTLVATRDNVFDRPIMPAIVCESMQVDVRWCCDKLNVHVFYV